MITDALVYSLKENDNLFFKVYFLQNSNFYVFFANDRLASIYGMYEKINNIYYLKANYNSYGSIEIQNEASCYVEYNRNSIQYKKILSYIKTKEYNISITIPEGEYIEKISNENKESFNPNNESFCSAPWTHLYLDGSGNAFPCCKNKKSGLGNIETETVKELWNTEKLKLIRKNMILGNKIPSCETCYLNEKRWGMSYRNFFNSKFANKYELVKNTNLDGSLDDVNISFLDLRYSNLCNLKCIMCSPYSSSAWIEDAKKIGTVSKDNIIKPINLYDSIKDQLPALLKNVTRINFAGGEPLLIKENYEILDQLISLKRFDVELTYNTNFSKLNNFNQDILAKWSYFKDITIKASLDAIRVRGEYIRKGLIWKDFFMNRDLLRKKAPHAKFKIFCTVQLLNVLHIPEMYRYLKTHMFIDGSPESFHLSFLDWPRYYDIRSLPRELKEKANLIYNKFIDELDNQRLKDHFKKILIYLNEQDYNYQSEFKSFTEKLDDIRKQDVKTVFPELKEYFDIINLH